MAHRKLDYEAEPVAVETAETRRDSEAFLRVSLVIGALVSAATVIALFTIGRPSLRGASLGMMICFLAGAPGIVQSILSLDNKTHDHSRAWATLVFHLLPLFLVAAATIRLF